MQLSNLMATLTMTEPHYIKCIKPNNVKAPGGFSPHLVLQQLNYSGVLEVVRIRRVGYPIRVPYQEFCDRFALLRKAAEAPEGLSDAQSAQTILERYCEPEYFQMGKTLVFLKEDGLELLRNEMRAEYSAKATKIQALARGYLCRKRLANEKVAAVKLQKVLRGFTRRSSFQSTRAKVELLQRVMRGNLVKKKYKGNRDSAIKLQALVRGVMARKELQRMRAEDGSARKIQAMWRGGVAHQQYKEKMRALRTIQLWLRRQLRNWSLRQQIAFAFKAAEDGQVNAIASIIQKNAEILYIRNRLDKFKALLHAAALGGNTSLVSLLDPLPEDLQLVDTDGNTPMHYAASSCCYDLVKLLAQKANQNVVIPDHISGKGTLDMNALEVRATKRISLRIIDRARTEMNKPHAVRR
jgi:myosin-5